LTVTTAAQKQPPLVVELETTNLPARVQDVTGIAAVVEKLALHPDVDVLKLEKVIELQERILTHQARSAFNTAFAVMQGEIPAIEERGKTNNGTYATLEDIVEKVRPILQRHGFTLSHRTEWPDAKTVRVIGILRHREGHEVTSEFLSGADASGNKNAIQGLGSAVSYGRRYTAKDLLNIVTRGEDDDARKSAHVNAPDGFDDWLLDLAAVADEGTARLEDAWRTSDATYKRHMLRTDSKGWEALKKKAGKVPA
jgi:hypothetical protein